MTTPGANNDDEFRILTTLDLQRKYWVSHADRITVTSWWARWRVKSPRLDYLSTVAQIKKTSKLRVTGLCGGNPPVTILWRHHRRLCHRNTVEPLWKGQKSLTKVAKFRLFPCTILYKSCLCYPSWHATSFERPPSWMAYIERFTAACNAEMFPI